MISLVLAHLIIPFKHFLDCWEGRSQLKITKSLSEVFVCYFLGIVWLSLVFIVKLILWIESFLTDCTVILEQQLILNVDFVG